MSNVVKIAKVYIFTSRGRGWLSNTIAFNSAPMSWMPQLKNVPSHAGLAFEKETGETVYFETHSPDGWRGPKPIQKLEAWVAKKPKQWVKYRELEFSQIERDRLWQKCHEKLVDPAWMDYRELQILGMLSRRIFRTRVKRSPSPVCSEAVAKILFPYYDLRLWPDKRTIRFDEITPWWVQVIPLERS